MKIHSVKKVFFTILMLLTAVALLLFSQQIREEILRAFTLAVQTVIPGLFPFLVLSQTVCATGFLQTDATRADKVMQVLFCVPSSCIAPIVFGLTGGYLAGIKTVRTMYDKGEISSQQAQKLSSFCFSPGPAFAIGAVGKSMLANAQSGILLFGSCTLAALLCGICTNRGHHATSVSVCRAKESLGISFTRAVQTSASACLSLSAWMAVFATVQAVFLQLIPVKVQRVFLLFAEVTGGVLQAEQQCSLPLCAAVLCFGGLCIFCQLLPDLQAMGISLSSFLKNRSVQALLSACLCRIGLFFFPSADFGRPTASVKMFRNKPVASLFLLFVCYIFILDLAPREKTWYTVDGR